MLLHWSQFAAVAAFVAVQAGLPLSLASEESSRPEPENAADNSQFWEGFRQGAMMSRFGQDWFGGVGGLLGPVSQVFDFLSPTRGSGLAGSSSLRLFMDQNDDASCQVSVAAPGFVNPTDLRVTFNNQWRAVGVSFRAEEKHERHDPQRGDSFSSRSVSGSSTMGLPERCIASAASIIAHHAGVVFAGERSPEEPLCTIVFPSRVKLQEYIDQKELPGDIIARIESGGELGPEELTEHQLCLAAGFTKQQCDKLGRRPRVASVPTAEAASGSLPLPVYDVSLGML